VSHKRFLVFAGNFKLGKPMLCFFLSNSTQLPSQEE